MNVSDWKPASPWEHRRTDGSGIVDMVGRVVKNIPPRSLVFTWARPKLLSNLKTFLETGRALPRG